MKKIIILFAIILGCKENDFQYSPLYNVDPKLEIILDRYLSDAMHNGDTLTIPESFTLIWDDEIPEGTAVTQRRKNVDGWKVIKVSSKYYNWPVDNLILERVVYHELTHALQNTSFHSSDHNHIMYPYVNNFNWSYYISNRDRVVSWLFNLN